MMMSCRLFSAVKAVSGHGRARIPSLHRSLHTTTRFITIAWDYLCLSSYLLWWKSLVVSNSARHCRGHMYQRSECSNKPIAIQTEGEKPVEKLHHFNSLRLRRRRLHRE
jgi:hypothetical protein